MRVQDCIGTAQKFLRSRRRGFKTIIGPTFPAWDEVIGQIFEACQAPALLGALATWQAIHLRCNPDGTLEVLDSDDGAEGYLDLPERFATDELPGRILAMGPAPAVFLARVEAWPFETLANVLSGIRDLFNQRVEVRTFLCGALRTRAFAKYWKERRDGFSAVLEDEVFWVRNYDLEDLRRIISTHTSGLSSDHLDILAQLVETHTALDPRFVDHLRHRLDEGPLPSGADGLIQFERLLHRMAGDGILADQVWENALDLAPDCLPTLEAALRHQVLHLSVNDPRNLHCEALAVRGLLTPPEEQTDKTVWRPASPVVAAILRDQWCRRFEGALAFPAEAEVIPLTLPVAVPAQILATRIENTLRNMLVLLGTPCGERHILLKVPRIENRLLYNETTRAVDEDRRDPGSRLVTRQLTSFLTTSQLMAVFTNNDLYEAHFAQVFTDKPQAMERLETFINLRNAIAHNKVLSLRVLTDLQSLLEYFEALLGTAAAESLEEDAGAEVTVQECSLHTHRDGTLAVRGSLSAQTRRLAVDIQGVATESAGLGVVHTHRVRLFLKPSAATHFCLSLASEPQTFTVDKADIRILRARPVA